MTKRYFVTGTDTEVGKTFVTAALLHNLNEQYYSTLGLKPVAAGCELVDGRWQNVDALILQQSASYQLDYELVNPVALPEAIAPHLAAENQGRYLAVDKIINALNPGLSSPVDIILIEGAGGWFVPLNEYEHFSDIPTALSIPVILVVGLRLGCINHALLTVNAIKQAGLPLQGWIGNCIDPHMLNQQQNVHALEQRIDAPCLGIVPYLESGGSKGAAKFLNSKILI